MSQTPGTGPTNDEQWPETPDELVYDLDRALETFDEIKKGRKGDLLETLLDCVDWREMFGSTGSGILKPEEIESIREYYRKKFANVERYYLAEQLSTVLMTALMSSGDIVFSERLKVFGRENQNLWKEIREFFSRKEIATAMLFASDTADPETDD